MNVRVLQREHISTHYISSCCITIPNSMTPITSIKHQQTVGDTNYPNHRSNQHQSLDVTDGSLAAVHCPEITVTLQ